MNASTPGDELEPPADHVSEKLRAILVAGMAWSPIWGTALAIANELVPSRTARSFARWMRTMAEEVRRLRERVDGAAQYIESEDFQDTLQHVMRSGMQTARSETRELLRRALLNSALQPQPSADITKMLLNLLDQLTPSHVKLLEFLRDQPEYFRKVLGREPPQVSNMGEWMKTALPEFAEPSARLINGTWADVRRLDLIENRHLELHEKPYGVRLMGLSTALLDLLRNPDASLDV